MKPLIKWAGGKRWLLPVLTKLWQPYTHLKLIEPFTGGMAVALGLNPKTAILNDANVHLINFYKQVQNGFQITRSLHNREDFYYAMRDEFNSLIAEDKHLTGDAATLFYFLMRTGFNGLCRFNNSGRFNVPFGQHNTINYRGDFLEYQSLFKKWQFKHGDFATLKLRGNEFIYADPPYDVQFTKYSEKDFTWDDQVRLAEWLHAHKGPIVASNQATKRVKELYQDLKFKIFTLEAPRMIACNGDRRKALEIIALKNITET